MPDTTTDEMVDAVALDVEGGVKSVTTGEQTTTLTDPTERLEAVKKIATARASAGGWGTLVHAARAVPPGSGPT